MVIFCLLFKLLNAYCSVMLSHKQVLTWAQGIMGKEYLVDGKFTGKDVSSTRAPQKYGLNTVDQVLGLS